MCYTIGCCYTFHVCLDEGTVDIYEYVFVDTSLHLTVNGNSTGMDFSWARTPSQNHSLAAATAVDVTFSF